MEKVSFAEFEGCNYTYPGCVTYQESHSFCMILSFLIETFLFWTYCNLCSKFCEGHSIEFSCHDPLSLTNKCQDVHCMFSVISYCRFCDCCVVWESLQSLPMPSSIQISNCNWKAVHIMFQNTQFHRRCSTYTVWTQTFSTDETTSWQSPVSHLHRNSSFEDTESLLFLVTWIVIFGAMKPVPL